jgi:myo-inositol 2-dehydrogenase/D-chiro-inositol 1-dehydrogenase
MTPPFRLGLIGAGRMGRTHLRALAGSQRVAVTAIAEVSEQTRRTVPAAGAPVYPGIAEMLEAETLDGVLIVVPTDRHLQVITEVAARGLPILCEKPRCGSASRPVNLAPSTWWPATSGMTGRQQMGSGRTAVASSPTWACTSSTRCAG